MTDVSEIRGIILDLCDSYENRVATVEALIGVAYRAVRESNGSLSKASRERESVNAKLQEILARNCSLRKKDFDTIMRGIVRTLEDKKAQLEETQERIEQELEGYLSRQKERIALLRERLRDLDDIEGVEQVLKDMKVRQENEAESVLLVFRQLRLELEALTRKQHHLNRRLQKLLEKGDLVEIEDIRRLSSLEARCKREIQRSARREEVERLLAKFGRERKQKSPRYRGGVPS
ncbi:MAG: hypothetical protein AB1700_08190 [Bacillota bacterium]